MSRIVCLHVTLYSRPTWGLTTRQVNAVIECLRTQPEVDATSISYAAGRRGGLNVTFRTHQPLDRVDRSAVLSRVNEGCKLVKLSDKTASHEHAFAGVTR